MCGWRKERRESRVKLKKKKKKKEAAMFPSHPNNGSSSREVMGLETVQLMI